MSNKKQTALDWYIEQNFNNIVQRETQQISQDEYVIAYNNLLEQAKQMQKEQIEIAFAKSYLIGCEEVSYNDANKASENYYNETYGGQDEH